VTVSGLQVLSTTWKSSDGTRSHWKYVVDNANVYRDVYRGSGPNIAQPELLTSESPRRLRFYFQPLPFGVRFSRRQLISFDMGDMHITEAEGKSRKRELAWGGLAARCSACTWQRVYDPNARKHQMPNDELSETVRREFENHKCQDHQSAD